MAKNKKDKRTRSFKVHSDFKGLPFIRFGGKYLINELGITCGDRLELMRDNDLIILRKYSESELTQYETAQKEKTVLALIKKLFPVDSHKQQALSMIVAEARTNTYSVDEEISKQPEKYSQD